MNEEMLQEQSRSTAEGEQSSVLRELAQAKLDNIHLKRQNLRIWSAVGLFAVSSIIAIYGAYAWFPKYRYIATKSNIAICEAQTQDKNPTTDIESVGEFAKDAVIHVYSYDYVNYQSSISAAMAKFFTFEGRKGYLAGLDRSKNLERVQKGHLLMRAFASAAPQIEEQGEEGGQKFWKVLVPVSIEFYVGGGANPTNTQDFVAVVTVLSQQASATNHHGLGVDFIELKPSSRKK